MKFDVNQLAELNSLLPTTMSIQSEVANLLSNFQAGPMAAEMRSTLPSLAPLDEQMSLLLQHSNRWRRLHIFAVQPAFIHHTMHRIGGVPRSVPLLRQFSVQVSTMECDPTDLAPELGGDLPFDGVVPSLQSLTLCYSYLPVQFFPPFECTPSSHHPSGIERAGTEQRYSTGPFVRVRNPSGSPASTSSEARRDQVRRRPSRLPKYLST